MTQNSAEAHGPLPVAFYLPQYHRIPENDAWWGDGFTEWTNVDAARPLFAGHDQPHVPASSLGRYDLLDRDVRLRQGEVARAHGIHAFCYYHYWFRGKRLLEAPLERMLADGAPDLPFMLAWANEPWTRRWDGRDDEVLQPQRYGSADDWSAHFDTLLRFFRDPRYVRVNGCPVFLIYRAGHVDCLSEMLSCWRGLAQEAGFRDLHLVGMLTSFDEPPDTFAPLDAVCELFPSWPRRLGLDGVHLRGVRVSSARQAWRLGQSGPRVHPVQYRGAFASWDNTPRLGARGYAFVPLTPDELRERMVVQCRRTREDAALPAPFVFINAWNEWAEGCHLEPDEARGTGWLEAVRDALRESQGPAIVSVIAAQGAPRPQVVRLDDAGVEGAARVPREWEGAAACRVAPGHPALRPLAFDARVLVVGAVDAEIVDIARLRHARGLPTVIDEEAVLHRGDGAQPLASPLARFRRDLLTHLRAFATLLGDVGTTVARVASDGDAMTRIRSLHEGPATAASVLGLIDLADTHEPWLAPLRLAGRQLNDLREPVEAARVLRRLLLTCPDDGDALCELARCLFLASQEAEAQALLSDTLARSPWHVRGWQYLLRALAQTRIQRAHAHAGDAASIAADKAAFAIARRAVEHLPENYVIGLLAVECCAPADGGRLLARVMDSLASSLRPDEAFDAALVTGGCFSRLGAVWMCASPSALEALDTACRLFPASARLADIRGRTLLREGRHDEALDALARADELRRTHAVWKAGGG